MSPSKDGTLGGPGVVPGERGAPDGAERLVELRTELAEMLEAVSKVYTQTIGSVRSWSIGGDDFHSAFEGLRRARAARADPDRGCSSRGALLEDVAKASVRRALRAGFHRARYAHGQEGTGGGAASPKDGRGHVDRLRSIREDGDGHRSRSSHNTA